MLERFGINITQLVGLLSFAAAAAACLVAALRARSRDALTWWPLALANAVFAVETIKGWRHDIHNVGAAILGAQGKYPARAGHQIVIIAALALIGAVCVALYLSRRRGADAPARAAGGIMIALLALFAIETVSLHAIDAVLYRPVGPVALIGWLWALAAAGMCVAAARER